MTVRTPVQIAWVTAAAVDTEAILSGLLGAKKWVRLPNIYFGPDTSTYRGAPADFVADISLSYAGDMQLEVIAPVRGQSIYTEFLSEAGSGLHHICVETDDMASALRQAEAAGAAVVQQGVLAGVEFAYVSAAHVGVPYVEIARISAEARAFFDYVKQEQK